jgi:hypothetical protein
MNKLIKSYTITPPNAKTEMRPAAPTARKTATLAGKDFFRRPQAPVYSGGKVIMRVESESTKTETMTQRVLRLKNEPVSVVYDDPAKMMDDLHK